MPTPKPSRSSSKKPTRSAPAAESKPRSRKPPSAKSPSSQPRLLSGGNPQIPKADGDPAVQAFIAAMPGWKRHIGQRLDALITATIPDVRKAVRWNSPFYGRQSNQTNAARTKAGQTQTEWFLAFHCTTKYIKVAFFSGTSLTPLPPVESKQKLVRYLHVHESDWGSTLDEKLLANWIRHASKLPGNRCF